MHIWISNCFPVPVLSRAFALALFGASAIVQAHDFCVTTTAEFRAALQDAGGGGAYVGQSNIIQLAQGTYPIGDASGNTNFAYNSSASTGDLTIRGGFDSTCTTVSDKAELTVLDGKQLDQVLFVYSAQGSLTVSGLTIQNGDRTSFGGGLYIVAGGDFVQLTVSGNIIRNNHALQYRGGLSVQTESQNTLIRVSHNVITGNRADTDFGGAEVISPGGEVQIYNNTVAQNTTLGSSGTGGMRCQVTGGNLHVLNNIFRGNSLFGVAVSGNEIVDVSFNDYGTLSGTPTQSAGNVQVDPKFVSIASGDFHLAGNSPLLGVSPLAQNGTDPDGNQDPQGGKMDMGAYNETIFTDSLEGN